MTETQLSKYPSLIRQYIEIQLKYPDAIVLMEVGSFYEIWQIEKPDEGINIGHAIKASQIMNITLTRRDKADPQSPRMAGVPNYTVDNYVKKIVEAGEQAVIVSQTKNGKKADKNKNIVREIERIVTPATYVDKVEQSKPKYFAACYFEDNIVGVSLIDVSTGEVRLTELPREEVQNYLHKNEPTEILFCSATQSLLSENSKIRFHFLNKKLITRPDIAGTVFAQVYDVKNPSSNSEVVLSKLGLEFWTLASLSLANLLNYLVDYNPLLLKKLGRPQPDHMQNSLFLPKNAFLSLDILENPTEPDSNQTLLGSLGNCKTSMGKRLLRHWLSSPLIDIDQIKHRQDNIASYLEEDNFLEDLKTVYDLPRLQRRISLESLYPHEIVFFYQSLKTSNKYLNIPKINQLISFLEQNLDLAKIEATGGTDWIFFKSSLLNRIKDDLKNWTKSKLELDSETDRIKKLLGSEKLRLVETKEHIQLIASKGLKKECDAKKVKYKLKASDLEILDEKWQSIAHQTFSLKHKYLVLAEALWMSAQTEISQTFADEVLLFSDSVAEIDVLSTLALIARDRNYSRPVFHDSENSMINFVNIRHPIVENSKTLNESYTPNSIKLDKEKNTLVIYGANSSGKSTLLKSLALNIIMAQIGSYIPCTSAELSVFENIMTRMTTYDQLSEGLSTFTMEMIELQSALKKVDKKTLFLFDEIGRGTSVEDGEAIAFATIEFLRKDSSNSLTLFATHYHKLYDNIKSFNNVDIKHLHCEITPNEEVVFHRQLMDGPGSGSYGIIVAKHCGLPEEIIRLAKNYNKDNHKIMTSRYNSQVVGSICQVCNVNQANETHHIIDQKQGTVKEIEIDGVKKSINDKSNLILICSNCHTDVTQNKVKIEKKKSTESKGFMLLISRLYQNDTDSK